MRKSVKYVAALLAATMTIGGLTGCVSELRVIRHRK